MVDPIGGIATIKETTTAQAQGSSASARLQRLFACQAIALRYSDLDARDGASAHNRNGAGDESEDDKDDDNDDWNDSSDLEENLPFDSEA